MCQQKNCLLSASSCCSTCNCDYSCYDCWDVKTQPRSLSNREEHNSSDIRHKFVCFSCKRVWKSYTNKYIYQKINSRQVKLSDLVPNICKPTLSKKKNQYKNKNITLQEVIHLGVRILQTMNILINYLNVLNVDKKLYQLVVILDIVKQKNNGMN